jgi:cytochrome c oxidase subunit 4
MEEVSKLEAESAERVKPLRYLVVWLTLSALAGLSLGLSRIDLGHWNVVISLTIAFAKATLVALFFMHLWEHHGASRLTLGVALVFVGLLTTLTVTDVIFRLPVTNPPTSRQALPYMQGQRFPEGREPSQSPESQPVAP